MSSYVGFGDSDIRRLALLLPKARPHFPAIASEFYAVVRMHQGAFEILKDEAQAGRLHRSLQVWLGEILGGPFGPDFVERHARIGQIHVQVGLEIRYMVTAMSRVRAALVRVATDVLPDDPASLRETWLSIDRACDIDLAIMLESYREHFVARVERAQARELGAPAQVADPRERMFGDVIEAVDVAVFVLDDHGRVVVANRKAVSLTGYAHDELADADLFSLLFGERASEVSTAWSAVTEDHPVETDLETRTRTGKMRAVRWHVTTHTRSATESRLLVAAGIDATHERELERQARQNERLAAAGGLAAGLAHEIRNPLNGATLHLSVLERAIARSSSVPPSAREATDVLRAELKRLSALVTDYLEVARPKPLARVVYDVNALAFSVEALLQPEAESRRVSLTVEPFPFPAVAVLDVERTKQVLINLIRNALEAVEEGGHVVVRVRRLPQNVEIDVADDGAGIGDPKAPIFDAFYTTKERGTGLGLSVVHRIVSDHGGSIRFESHPGSTVFTVRLPIQ
jgi:PAS domain S-box-containing protein